VIVPGSKTRLTLAQVVEVLEHHYPQALAQPWDAVGLVCGDPSAPVSRVMFTVDPSESVVDEALEWRADLIVAHHPLLFRGVNSVAATTSKGRRIHRLIPGGCALLTAHTNADAADPGVSDALARALGIGSLRALAPAAASDQKLLQKLTAYVPGDRVDDVIEALSLAGAGSIGDYDHCAYTVEGVGQFRPLPGASPAIGSVGGIERVAEVRVEMVLDSAVRRQVEAALLATHPYERPAYDFIHVDVGRPLARGGGNGDQGGGDLVGAGLGRIGQLDEPIALGEFARRVAQRLPHTAAGVKVAGDLDRAIRRVAVCGGSGDSLLDAANASGADVFVTADLRHHVVEEHLADGGCPVIDVAHWASEWPWLEAARDVLVEGVEELGATVETRISELVTDPWSGHHR